MKYYSIKSIICAMFLCAAAPQGQLRTAYAKSSGAIVKASVVQAPVSPVFVVTVEQARKAFDEAEQRGEQRRAIVVGEMRSTNISGQSSSGAQESLTLSVLFLSPLEEARARGYAFGLVAKTKSPSDRKGIEDQAVASAAKDASQVNFRILLQAQDENANIPGISFELIDKAGKRVTPSTQPASFTTPRKDLPGTMGLAQNGQELTFPLFDGSVANLTNAMDKMVLVVKVAGAEQRLEYRLK